MPTFNMKDRKKSGSPWKSIAKSILSPYIPKNKLLLREMLRNHENTRNASEFSIRKVAVSLSKNLDKKPVKIKQKMKSNIHLRVETTPNDLVNDVFSIFPQQSHVSSQKFSIFVRRRSCHCEFCGENTKFEEKINKLLPHTQIKYFIQEEKKRIKSMIERPMHLEKIKTRAKAKTKVAMAFAPKSQNTIIVTNNAQNSMLRSAMLKNPIESFTKRRRSSIAHNYLEKKEAEPINNDNSIEMNTFDLHDKSANLKEVKFQRIPNLKNTGTKVEEAIKWKYKPGAFLDKLLTKNEKISNEIREIYGKRFNLDDFIPHKRDSNSVSYLKKADFINNAYDTTRQLNFLKNEITNPARRVKKLPVVQSFHVNSSRNANESSLHRSKGEEFQSFRKSEKQLRFN